MKVFVVVRVTHEPDYCSGGIDEYRHVEFVTADEKIANKFCLANKPATEWHDSFEIEKCEMR
jgi:hypothetical protein